MAWPIQLGTVKVWRGDALSFPITVKDSTGAVVNLTGYGSAWTSMIRASLDAATAVSFTVDATAAATGVLTLSLTGTQTAALTRGVAYGFDVQATGGTLTPFTLFQGALEVGGEFTHA